MTLIAVDSADYYALRKQCDMDDCDAMQQWVDDDYPDACEMLRNAWHLTLTHAAVPISQGANPQHAVLELKQELDSIMDAAHALKGRRVTRANLNTNVKHQSAYESTRSTLTSQNRVQTQKCICKSRLTQRSRQNIDAGAKQGTNAKVHMQESTHSRFTSKYRHWRKTGYRHQSVFTKHRVCVARGRDALVHSPCTPE